MSGFISFTSRHKRFALATALSVAFVGIGIYAEATSEAVLRFQPWTWQAVGAAIFFVAVLALLHRWAQEGRAQTGAPAQPQGKIRWPWSRAHQAFAPPIRRSLPIRLTDDEIARRIQAIDQMYEVLNTKGASLCKAGKDLVGPMRDHIRDEGSAAVSQKIGVWRDQVLDLIKAVQGVRHQRSLQEMVFPKDMFEFGFKPALWNALDETSSDLGLLTAVTQSVDLKVMRDHMLLIEHRIRQMQQGVNILEEWIGRQKQALELVRDALSRSLR